MSDCHSSYLVLTTAKSKLTQYGYYHYWVNHSDRYVHENYHFVYTAGIERAWRSLKYVYPSLKYAHKACVINEYANAFTMREILKREKAHEFHLRLIS
jgi:hypothetical protein